MKKVDMTSTTANRGPPEHKGRKTILELHFIRHVSGTVHVNVYFWEYFI